MWHNRKEVVFNPSEWFIMPERWSGGGTTLFIAHRANAVLFAGREEPHGVAVISARQPAGENGVRACWPAPAHLTSGWWPAVSLSSDSRVASAIADQLTCELPVHMRWVSPEASVVVAAALHAASMVDWPPITIAHLLESGSVATFIELLAGGGSEDLALDLSAVAGDLAPDRESVLLAASAAVSPLVADQGVISGPGVGVPGPGPFFELRCTPTDDGSPRAICIDATSTLGAIAADRARHLAQSEGMVKVNESTA